MPHVTVNGLRLHFRTVGERDTLGRPSIVLLHGLGSAGDDWPLQIPVFAPRFRLIAPDLPGHGRSDRPVGPRSIRAMAADLAALLDHLDEPPAHLVGLSLGGCVALQSAIDRPARVRSLVLVNGFAQLRPAGLRGALRFGLRLWLLAFAPMQSVAEAVAHGLFPKPEQREFYQAAVVRLAANPKGAYWNAVRALLAFDARRDLGRVRCPTLVLAGDRDGTIPMSAKVRLQQGIPGARLVVVPDSGHATPYDQAELFNRLVLEFVGAQT